MNRRGPPRSPAAASLRGVTKLELFLLALLALVACGTLGLNILSSTAFSSAATSAPKLARPEGRVVPADPSPPEPPPTPSPTATKVSPLRAAAGDDLYHPNVRFQLGEYFLPGSLTLNRTVVLSKCWVPPGYHLSASQGCTVSRKHKIIYHLTPKSGSSTGRHVVKNDFEGKDFDNGCRVPAGDDPAQWIQIATLRNPTTRAFASYEEMFVRSLGNIDRIPSNFRAFMEPFRHFVYKNYSAMFDIPEKVAKLNEAYETFMRDWDGSAFDMHLASQVSYNLRKPIEHRRDPKYRPSSKHLTMVFDTHNMDQAFASLASMVGLDKRPVAIHGRAYPRRMNVSMISKGAFRAMCRAYAEDYCCLNYPLPSHCLDDGEPRAAEDRLVRCRWRVEGEHRWIQTELY